MILPTRIVRVGLALLLATAAPLRAQDGAGASSAILLQLAPAPRPLALGGAYAAFARDPYALFYNPSRLAGTPPAVGAAYHAYPVGVAAGSIAATLPFDRLALAVGVHYLDLGEVEVVEPDPAYAGQRGRATGEVTDGGEVLAVVGGALELGPSVRVGAAAKALRFGLAGASDQGFAVDLGATASLLGGRVQLGAAVQNLGPDVGPGRRAPLPRTVRAAAAVDIVDLGGVRTAVGLDAVHVEQRLAIAAGLEAGYRAGAGLALLARAGFDGRARTGDAASPVTVGGGIAFGRFGLDYAYRGAGPLGATHHFGFSVKLAGETDPAR
jgi:hypothetical protein